MTSPRMKTSLSWWEAVVSRSTKGLTPEQVTAAAQICLDTGCCAWHGAALVTGEQCRCVSCMLARGEE